ncbi:MAG: UDP-N-acetylmuramoyl-tripeptide--D-alanyl-D-alanine ligase [Firmicutes bacterium]|nr:UDP-N-acetylmuramoyl-tripeptide--D-alanyl-D-alanine ligase [Bacillota bacterium]
MKKMYIRQIAEGVKGQVRAGSPDGLVTGISTDSRTAGEGDLFFPLKGERFDAHDFIPQALKQGCRSFVVSRKDSLDMLKMAEGVNVIEAADTTKALQDLSSYYLDMLGIRKIAVTGSTGKTTTRDMIKCILGTKYKTYSNEGNFNNHIGVPLTILSIDEDAEMGVFEMGMDKFGEIHALVDIVRPDTGVITNIGVSHIENLGSREGIFKAKMEITDYFDEKNTLVVYEDDEYLNRDRIDGNYRLITAGRNGRCDFIVSHLEDRGIDGIRFMLEHDEEAQMFELPVPGAHNAYNAAVAAAAASLEGITLKEAEQALRNLELTDKRLTVRTNDGIKVIDDTYNASPSSMKSALDALASTNGIRRVAILGDMFELGEDSPRFHREVGQHAAGCGLDLLITVGELSANIRDGALETMDENKVMHYEKKEDFMKEMNNIIDRGDVILVKGSNGMGMFDIVDLIMERQEQ